MARDGLSGKQKAFIEEYLVDRNATRAAERAGYRGSENTLAVTGYENLRNPKISEIIERRMAETSMMADEALALLAGQARGDMSSFVKIADDGRPSFDLGAAQKAGALRLVRKLRTKTRTYLRGKGETAAEVTETEISLELHDAQAALTTILRTHGKLDERGSKDNPLHVHITSDEMARARDKARQFESSLID